VLYLQDDRLEDAEASCRRALAVHRDVGHREAQGATLATLGALLGRARRFAEARATFEEGAKALRDTGDREELSLLLCERAAVVLAEGDVSMARRDFAEAESIAAALELDEETEPGRKLRALRARLA
jgi:hypothetical protein